MATFSEFLSSFDPNAGKRGKQFEHFIKWFLKNDPEWATQVDQVWLWEEYPQSWGRDCGIDLVFKHKNGENWAVQAKCYAPTTSITKADVDSFISESNRDGIDKLLLIATTDLIGANAKQVCDAQDKKVTRYLLSHFDESNIEYPASIEDLSKAKPKDKPKPREHQLEAIEAVTSNFKDTDRGQMIMACGTGKTFTTLWIKEKLGVDSTLVLLPSLGLLSQTLHEWTMAANEPFEVLCVCSDESVGKKGSDEAVHSVHDLAFPVTSNSAEIKVFLNRSGKKVIFSTYQSSPLIAEAQVDPLTSPFDLAIADEAHRCAGKVSGDFSTILDAQKIRAKKRLFTTATPRTYSSNVKKTAEDRGVEVVGMDDEAVFGKQLFALKFGEAIKRGLLTDYRVVIIGVDDPTISEWIENRELLQADSDIEMDAESLAAQVGLLKAIKDYDLRRMISFHSRVSRAEEFSKDIHKVVDWIDEKHKPSGELKSDFVSGEMPTDKRRKKLAQLKGLQDNQRGLLTNAKCLSEGVDVPSLDGVAFIDPRSSQIDIIQAVGRAIRLSTNKKSGTIVLPVFIGSTDDPEQALEEGNFKPIWDVLNALKAHDDVLADELSQIRTELGRKGGGKVEPDAFSKITIDLPLGIDKSFGDGLRTLLVERTTESWDYWYRLLLNYVNEYGDALVSNSYFTDDGYSLGKWLSKLRGKRNFLSRERIEKLEVLPKWTWNVIDSKWDANFSELEKYIEKHGNANVPQSYITNSGVNLGIWVGVQRSNRADILKERKDKLESIKTWSWDPRNDRWENGFIHLLEVVKRTGSSFFPAKGKTDDGFALGRWMNKQRQRRETLQKEQFHRLDELPDWKWKVQDELWEIGFNHLAEYVKANGKSNMPNNYICNDGYALGNWAAFQRQKKSKLTEEQIRRLEGTNGWSWTPNDDLWEYQFKSLAKIYEHADASLPKVLNSWVRNQRINKEKLSKEKLSKLDNLKGWTWDPPPELWDKSFALLLDYVKEHGNAKVPFKYVTSDGYKLGSWVNDQRQVVKDPLKKSKLESLPGWVWRAKENHWVNAFKKLQEYSIKYGDCNVPASYTSDDGFRLGIWVQNVRKRKNTLSDDQLKNLESMNSWLWTVRSRPKK
jgi:superfamily II DNA or RNA helicase